MRRDLRRDSRVDNDVVSMVPILARHQAVGGDKSEPAESVPATCRHGEDRRRARTELFEKLFAAGQVASRGWPVRLNSTNFGGKRTQSGLSCVLACWTRWYRSRGYDEAQKRKPNYDAD